MRKYSFILAWVIVSSFFVTNSYAQGFNRAKLDSLFTLIEENSKGMGSFSIFKDGKEVYQNTIGYADLAAKQKANALTKYRVGSISKTFTAVIIMQLIEENKLSFSTKLNSFFPSIPNAEKITIRQMLRHRSGIYNFTNSKTYSTWMQKSMKQKELIKRISENEASFAPDEKADYSNSNYVLLALIAEAIDKKQFKDIFKARILNKCDLKNTKIGSKINTDKNEALSYSKVGEWLKSYETDMSVPIGAGSVISTPTDLNTFFYTLFDGKLISAAHLDSMKYMQDEYGMGLFKYSTKAGSLYGHTGGIDAFQSMSAYMPSKNIVVSYTANAVEYPRSKITNDAMKIYFGKEYDFPDFSVKHIPSKKEIISQLGIYSSPSFPLKITISEEKGRVVAQATGQSAFPLEATEKNKYKFEAAGIKLSFNPAKKTMTLYQGGKEFELTKE